MILFCYFSYFISQLKEIKKASPYYLGEKLTVFLIHGEPLPHCDKRLFVEAEYNQTQQD